MNWKLGYAIGFHPWEDAAKDAGFTAKFADVLDKEERGREPPPYGRALDVGTGSGIWAVELARRGWDVTGVDVVAKALDRARGRVEEAGVDVRLVPADVTKLREAGIDPGFQLVLDTGTFHDLDDAAREAMGREVSAVAAADATVLLLVWPERRRPLIRGANRDAVERAFPGWTVTDVEASRWTPPKILELILHPDEHWYRLRRS